LTFSSFRLGKQQRGLPATAPLWVLAFGIGAGFEINHIAVYQPLAGILGYAVDLRHEFSLDAPSAAMIF
jgi:hypothetical protein